MQPTESRNRESRKGRRGEERGERERERKERRNRPGRETRNIFYSRCGLDPTPYLFLNLSGDLPLCESSHETRRTVLQEGLDVFDESIQGYFRYANSLSRLGNASPPPPALSLSLSLPISILASLLTTNQRS